MNKSNAVGWFDIYVTNFERAKQFYQSVFQVELSDLPIAWGKQAVFPFNPENPNISGALVEKKDRQPGGNNTIVYFETADCTAEVSRMIEAGGKVIQPKMHIGEFGYVAIFMDTEGNTVGLHSYK